MFGTRRPWLSPPDLRFRKGFLEDVGDEHEERGSVKRTRYPVAAAVFGGFSGIEVVGQLNDFARDPGRVRNAQGEAIEVRDRIGHNLQSG
jgi:hypothetical protein